MASTYPGQIDTFIGAPYTDGDEFVLSLYANQWTAAIVAIENTLGAGAQGATSDPLYSVPYGTGYSTVAARLTAIETSVGAGVKLNSAPGNIEPIATSAAAGASGIAADASHVHGGMNTLIGNIKPIATVATAGNSGFVADASHVHGGLNTAAGNVAAVGANAASGASGLVADAAHVHQGVTSIANGYGIGQSGGDGSGHGALTQAIGLTSIFGAGSGVPTTGTFQILATQSLPIGSYFVFFLVSFTIQPGPGSTLSLQQGSATASIVFNPGIQVGGVFGALGSTLGVAPTVYMQHTVPAFIQVSSPGTILFLWNNNANPNTVGSVNGTYMGLRVG